MSACNLHASKIPRNTCLCRHHNIIIPCPVTAEPKLKPRCCVCKKYQDQSKSSGKLSTAPDESMAGEPNVDDPGGPEDASPSGKIKFNHLEKELFSEKNKVEKLEKDLYILKSENESLKRSRDDAMALVSSLQEQIPTLTTENKSLRRESDGLKEKLKTVEDREEKRNSEISDEVQKMRNVIREKESSLTSEKNELSSRILELTNTAKQQKKKISELTSICAKKKSKIEENEKKISSKATELSDTEKKFKSKCCECKDLQEEIENLKHCLNQESKAANDFKKGMDECKDNCRCEVLMKDKMIEDQKETIKRLKNILHDKENLVQQSAREYELLTDELYLSRQENNDLKMSLEEIAQNFESRKSKKCHQCLTLEEKLNYLFEQKEKALIGAKYAAKTLYEATDEFESQLNSEKQQHSFLMSIVKQKELEIECLKKEIHHMKLYKQIPIM